jgi:ATP-dependent exoDNAse (exonuclease V) beta subunit
MSESQAQRALLALFDERWQQQKPDIDRLQLPQRDIDAFYNESRQMLITWLKRHLAGEFTRPQVEVRLTSPRHRLMGIIDAIFHANGTVTIVDYKTGAKAAITQDIKVQMAIYALLYTENFGVVPHYVAVDFLKAGLTKRFRVTEPLVKAAAKLCARIHDVTQSTDETHYPCRCGGWCDKDFILENGRC